jgi:hypothetical protein
LEIYLIILESFSSSDEDYLGFLGNHILRDREILFCCIYIYKKIQDTFTF